jgi:PAS domain S-box-containing protein
MKTKLVKIVLLVAFLCILPDFRAHSDSTGKIPADFLASLTSEEKAFLSRIGPIRVHSEKDWAPFNFNKNGEPSGFSIDYMKLLAEKTGLEIRFVGGPTWDQFMNMIKNGEIDVMLNIAENPERKKFLRFTPPYVTMIQMLYTRKEAPTVSSIRDLYGKRFAVPKGFFIEGVLKAHPQIQVVTVADTYSAIRAVSTGKADALFDLMPVVDYITNQLQVTNLKVGGDLGLAEGKPIPLHIAVRKDNQALLGILEKGMKRITGDDVEKLHKKWLTGPTSVRREAAPAVAGHVDLTREEREFLKDRNIRLGIDSARPPFEYLDKDGAYRGISADFIQAAADKLGIRPFPLKELPWPEAMKRVRTGDVDVIPKVTPSKEREKFLTFTKPYLTFPSVIVMDKGRDAGSLKDLAGLKVGVNKGQIVEANLRRDYPHLLLIPFPDIKTGLRALIEGKIDAYVDNLGAVAYTINSEGFTSLKIAHATEYNHDLAFGVRKDWPLLASALDKALQGMTDQEKQDIINRWLAIDFKPGIDWKTVGPVLAALFIIIVFVLVWNRRLSKAVRERERSQREFRAMSDAVVDALIMMDSRGRVMFWNPAAEKLFGYASSEAMGKDFHELAVPPENRDKASDGIRHFAKTGQGVVFGSIISTTAIDRRGRVFPVEVSLSPFQMEKEWFAVGTVRDITERKQAEQALAEGRERLQRIFDASPLAVAISVENVIRFCNPRFTEWFGVGVGTAVADYFVRPGDLAKVNDLLKVHQKVANHEIQMYGADSKIHDFLISFMRIEHEGRHGLLAWLMDITERKAAEEAVRRAEERSRTILNSLSVGTVIIDRETKRIDDINPVAVRMIGLPREEIIGKICHKFICPREERQCPIIDLGLTIDNAERVLLNAAGAEIPVIKTVVPVMLGDREYLLESFVDITERKQMEEELREHMSELEKFMELTVNREEKMIELKEEINTLLVSVGQGTKYRIVE